MEFDGAIDVPEKLNMDYAGGNFIFRGLTEEELKSIQGVCSLNIIGRTAIVSWYDLTNMFTELKKLGHTEAEFTDDGVLRRVKELQEYDSDLNLLRNGEVCLNDEEANKILFKIQKAGTAFLLGRKNSALFDQMGTGKTIEAIFAYKMIRERIKGARCLIIAPKTVKLEWRDAFKKFLNIKATPIEDLPDGDDGSGEEILLAHYDQLISRRRGDNIKVSEIMTKLLFQKFTTIIADEAHFVKNHRVKRTKAFLTLIRKKAHSINSFEIGKVGDRVLHSTSMAPFVWFLTGTPMERADDMYVMLKHSLPGFVPAINYLDTFTDYETKYYYGKKIKVAKGLKNEDKLLNLIGKFSLRRSRSEIVEIDYLEKTIKLNLDKKMRDEYARVIADVENPLTGIVRGVQFCNNPELLDLNFKSPKYEAILDIVQSTDKKIVIWTVFRNAVDKITEFLRANKIGVVSLKGGDNIEQVKTDFLKPENQVIVSTISKGGTGINFMKYANTVIYVERPFSYTLYAQSYDRVMRVDRDLSEPVLFINLHINNSTDDLLDKVIEQKTTLYKLILGGLENMEDYGIDLDQGE